MKKNTILIGVLILIVLILIYLGFRKENSEVDNQIQKVYTPSEQTEVKSETPVKDDSQSTEMSSKFTGKLEKLDTGCFADGECFVVVDGKHVTLIRGWSSETVGQVIGGDNSIGGLEKFIGKDIEVYARKIDANNYTLYGNSSYYVKVK